MNTNVEEHEKSGMTTSNKPDPEMTQFENLKISRKYHQCGRWVYWFEVDPNSNIDGG